MIYLSRKASNLVLLFLELKEILFSTAAFSYSQSMSAIPLSSTPGAGLRRRTPGYRKAPILKL